MNTQRTNILIMGVGRSGSHALVDLLSEYNNVAVFPDELDDFRAPGLIADQLDERLRGDYPNMIRHKLSPLPFKSELFYKSIPKNIQHIEWLYPLVKNKPGLDRRIKRYLYRHKLEMLNIGLKSDITDAGKFKLVKNWISDIAEIYSSNDDNITYVVFDQPITWHTNTDIWTQTLDPFKMIASIRNPKDQLANMVKDRYLFHAYGAPLMNWGGVVLEAIYGRSRRDALAMFIKVIEKSYERILEFYSLLGKDQFLLITFENLVNHYEVTKSLIENFLDIGKEHHNQQSRFFNPLLSARNIGYSNQYLSIEEINMINGLEEKFLHLKNNVSANNFGADNHVSIA